MRIGLLRHFPVAEPLPSGWMTAAQLHAWRERYEASPARPTGAKLEASQWPRCYASDLLRAYTTARALYPGEIVQTPLLREVEVAEFRTGNLELPVRLWKWIIQGAFLTGHRSQRTSRDQFVSRVRAAADLAESAESDALMVSHAGTMLYLRKELIRRGFRGPRFTVAEHARLYVFERNSS
ncbi:MAG TPA: histidine phosphatase family protein [Chthoniobacteraceae bacterium]|jgi:broad specificity phosphatase PhoE|nr:histidine phosphatase family protein [Chthoniobacteraceae bacterium]